MLLLLGKPSKTHHIACSYSCMHSSWHTSLGVHNAVTTVIIHHTVFVNQHIHVTLLHTHSHTPHTSRGRKHEEPSPPTLFCHTPQPAFTPHHNNPEAENATVACSTTLKCEGHAWSGLNWTSLPALELLLLGLLLMPAGDDGSVCVVAPAAPVAVAAAAAAAPDAVAAPAPPVAPLLPPTPAPATGVVLPLATSAACSRELPLSLLPLLLLPPLSATAALGPAAPTCACCAAAAAAAAALPLVTLLLPLLLLPATKLGKLWLVLLVCVLLVCVCCCCCCRRPLPCHLRARQLPGKP